MAIKEQNIGSSVPATKGDVEQAREDTHLDIEQAVQASEQRVLQEVRQTKDEVRQSKEEIIYEFRAAHAGLSRDSSVPVATA